MATGLERQLLPLLEVDGLVGRWAPGHRGHYFVTPQGDVYSCSRNGTRHKDGWFKLKPDVGHNGYLRVTLSKGNKRWTVLVHRLVLTTFVGKAKGLMGLHGDGNPLNNHIDNLRWGSGTENAADRLKHGRQLFGEDHTLSKLTDEQCVVIRKRYAVFVAARKIGSPAVLAKEFGVDPNTIIAVGRGRQRKVR